MIEATASNYTFGALLESKEHGTQIRVLNNVRGDEFDAITESGEVTVHSREAHCHWVVEDGSNFNPSPEFMALVRTYS